MADEHTRDTDRDRPTRKDEDTPTRAGDVLGLSDASPDVEIPRATDDRGGNPAGVEVRQPASGTGALSPGKGATGIDMGSGGSGTDVDPTGTRPGTRRTD